MLVRSDAPAKRWMSKVGVGLVAGALLACGAMAVAGEPGVLGEELQENFHIVLRALTSAKSAALIALILLAERFWPARPDQRIMGPSYVMDAFYVFVHLPIVLAVLITVMAPLRELLDNHAGWMVLDSSRDLPAVVVLAIGLMFTDFLAWLSHLVLHKVGWFWRFHMIHHAQANLNLFTANRAHPVDSFIGLLIRFLPAYFIAPGLTEEASTMALFLLAMTWHIRFQHSNVAWTMGPLRHIFVTPQSHRIHHSIDPEHWNSNYANIFTFWDRLFGTHNGDTSVYPETGIHAETTLDPMSYRPSELLRCYTASACVPLHQRRPLGDVCIRTSPTLAVMTALGRERRRLARRGVGHVTGGHTRKGRPRAA